MGDATPHFPNQAAIWNGPAGRSWVEAQAMLDEMFAPIADFLTSHAQDSGAVRALDVGCGAGATTLCLARVIGECVGVDISEALVATARERADAAGAPASFLLGDAQDYAFEAEAYDLIVSRFGVMFFADPVAAFDNLRRAARPGGALQMVVWRSAQDNPFMTAAERAAAHLLPDLTKRKNGVAGPFGFSDVKSTRRILEQAGWETVQFTPRDFTASFDRADLELYMTRLGALGLVFETLEPETQAALIDLAPTAYAPFINGDRIEFTAACWVISANAPASPGEHIHER